MQDETIEVRYRPAAGSPPTLSGYAYYHKYIVYTDSNGNEFAARAGNEFPLPGVQLDFGAIIVEYGPFDSDFPDNNPPAVNRNWFLGPDPSEEIERGSDLSAYWADITAAMDYIGSSNFAYIYDRQNSNAAVDYALEYAGLPPPQDDGVLANWAPGSGHPLFIPYDPNALLHLAEALINAMLEWMDSPLDASPLVLDLDGDGIELTTFDAETTTTFFDIDNDGFAEQTAWVGADDGLLALDANEDGAIEGASELFGSPTVDGFAILAELDTNGDLVIDANDAAFGDLLIWKDTDGDGISQTAELKDLAYYDIESISLAGVTASTSTISGNAISHTSTFKLENGTTRAIADAWFTHSNLNTYYAGDYTLDGDALFLPTLRGFGELPNLTIAMSQDGDLLDLVAALAENWDYSVLGTDLNGAVEDILYKWAGVESVNPTSRGPNVDARQLEFLEAFFGSEFRSHWGDPNPQDLAGMGLTRAWDFVRQHLTAALIMQSGADQLFDGDIAYDPSSGDFVGAPELSEAEIGSLVAYSTALGVDTDAFWISVGELIQSTRGLDTLTVDEELWLDDAVTTAGGSESWTNIKAIAALDAPSPNVINGTSGAETINGTAGNDEVNAGSGNDTLDGFAGHDDLEGDDGNDIISGGDGNDVLYGEAGQDTLSGGAHGDTLYGGTDDDLYIYDSGNDVFQEGGGTDIIQLPNGIELGDLTFRRLGNENLLIEVGTLGTIEIVDQFNSSPNSFIETVRFYDTSTFSLSTLDDLSVNGTEEDDFLQGIISGGGSNDILYGLGGNDFIEGLNGNDTLDGGVGNDDISGGDGADTYIASPGFDNITEDALYQTTDTIHVPTGYGADDLTFFRNTNENDLTIFVAGLGQILIYNQFNGSYWNTYIEQITFEDGDPAIDLTTRQYETRGSGGNDTLSGISFSGSINDTIHGFAGNDTLYGEDGDDRLLGGAGNDNLNAGNDDDTLVYVLAENASATDDYEGDAGFDTLELRFTTAEYTSTIRSEIQSHWNFIESNYNESSQNGSSFTFTSFGLTVADVETITVYVDGDLQAAMPITGTSGNDTLTGAAGPDHIQGLGGADTLTGNGGDDILDGGAANDTLYGNAGDDVLYMGPGVDQLYGGDDADWFTVNTASFDADSDNIWDFDLGEDDGIWLKDVLIGYTPGTSDVTEFVFLAPTTSGDTRLFVDRDGTAGTYSSVRLVYIKSTNMTDEQALLDGGHLLIHVNHNPDAQNDSFSGTEDQAITGNVLSDNGNGVDSDSDGDTLSALAETKATTHGSVTILSSGGFTYTPAANYNGSDSFTYTLQDGRGGSDTGTVNLTLSAVADAPVAQDDNFTGIRNENVVGNLLSNNGNGVDSDGDGDTLSVTAETKATAQGGSVVISSNGSFTYTPATDYIGADSFNYTLGDGQGGSDTGTANLTVNPYNIITGSSGNNTLNGTSSPDLIRGLGGNDTIYGNDNDDLLYIGSGTENIYGGNGADAFAVDLDSFDANSDTIHDFDPGEDDYILIEDILEGYTPGTSAITDFVFLAPTNDGDTRLFVDRDGTGSTYSSVRLAYISDIVASDEQAWLNNGTLVVAA